MPIRSFLDLDVYQRAYKASIIVHKKIIPNLPPNEKYNLGDQMGRASKAIPAIIAEGYGRKSQKEYAQFYATSYGSALELETQLIISKELKLASLHEFKRSEPLLLEVVKMLNSMLYKLRIKNYTLNA